MLEDWPSVDIGATPELSVSNSGALLKFCLFLERLGALVKLPKSKTWDVNSADRNALWGPECDLQIPPKCVASR